MKKIFALFLVILSLLSLSFAASAASTEKLKVIDIINKSKGVIDTFNGVAAKCDKKTLDGTSASTLQCSEFVKRYFSTYKGLSISNLLPGQRIYADGVVYDKNGYKWKTGTKYRKALKSSGNPKVGDLASYNNGYHFAIVKAVDKNKISATLIEQNWTWLEKTSSKPVTYTMYTNRNRVVSGYTYYDGYNFEYVKQ